MQAKLIKRLWCIMAPHPEHLGDLLVIAKRGYPDIPLGANITVEDAEHLNITVEDGLNPQPPPPDVDHPHYHPDIEHSEDFLAFHAERKKAVIQVEAPQE